MTFNGQSSATVKIKPIFASGAAKSMTLTVTDAAGATQTVNANATITGPTSTNQVLWLKGDAGVTYDGSNLVSQWADQSGAGHHATQSTDASKPLYVASALNSVPGVRFDGGNDRLVISGSFAIAQVFIVFKALGASFPNYSTVLGNTNSSTRPFIFEQNNTFFHSNQFPVAVWKNGTSLTSPFDLGTITNYMSMTVSTYSPGTSRTYYVGSTEDSYFANVEIVEMIGYSAVNTTTDREGIEAYLDEKYGL